MKKLVLSISMFLIAARLVLQLFFKKGGKQ